jgi:hypothetical protein
VNITPVGGEYRWHYDRNAVTGILYLNEVSGGETEMYSGCRIYLGRYKDTIAQRWLDKISRQPFLLWLFGNKMCVAPRTGTLIVMRGDQCLHSVRRVESGERVNVIMAFDRPGASFAVQKHLDSYLYSQSAAPQFDPNYRSNSLTSRCLARLALIGVGDAPPRGDSAQRELQRRDLETAKG